MQRSDILGAWHPERVAGAKLDATSQDISEVTRKRFLAELDNIPIAQRSYRLRQLGRILERAEEMGNISLSNPAVKLAAKEVGDFYVRRGRAERSHRKGASAVAPGIRCKCADDDIGNRLLSTAD